MDLMEHRVPKEPYGVCLSALIEAQVARTPNATAVRFEETDITFAELNVRANRLAHYLKGLGVGPDDVVGVVLDRSIDMVVALVAVLKAGGAYLPLDPEYPALRKLFMLQDAGASVVLTRRNHVATLTGFEGTCFDFDAAEQVLSGESGDNLASASKSTDLAYVIYTSGSTGQPKGCMISHAAISNRLLWMQDQYCLSERDRVLQKTPYTFDVSVWEVFWPLLSGACLVVAKPGGHRDNRYLVDLIRREAISVCHFVPSMLRLFLKTRGVAECTTLRDVFVSGEALSHKLVQEFRRALPATKAHNLYGPTEAAVDVTYWECEEREDQRVPIGRPIANIAIRILDDERRPVPTGEEGELYIAGVGVARGYLNRPELTAERFVDDPFGSVGSKMYRSGDRARVLADGNIEFLGRADFQVKLRGLRIELGEIEAALRAHPQVADATVAVKDEESIDPKLAAYVVSTGGALEIPAMKLFLAERIPNYMVPNVFAQLKGLPVTAHGKLDRAALPWPIEPRASEVAAVHAQAGAARVEITEQLGEWAIATLGIPRLTHGDNLFDLGATSLTLVQLVEVIERRYGISVPVDVVLDTPDIETIAGYVHAQMEIRPDAKAIAESGSADEAAPHAPAKNGIGDVARTIRQIALDALSVPALEQDDNLFDFGATSLTLVQIVEQIARRMDVAVPVDVILDLPTLTAITTYVAQALPRASGVNGQKRAWHEKEERRHAEARDDHGVLPLIDIPFRSSLFDQGAMARHSSSAPLELSSLGRFLGVLAQHELNGRNRFLYPSAGDLTAVQAYVYVGPGRVRGLLPGLYYYHPVRHALVCVNDSPSLEGLFMGDDRSLAGNAGFVVFLVGELAAIEPIYRDASHTLLEVEAGYISQLLLNRQHEFGVAIGPLSFVDDDVFRTQGQLRASQYPICALAGGRAFSVGEAIPQERCGVAPSDVHKAYRHWRRPRYSSVHPLTQELIDQLHREHRHLRQPQASEAVVTLERYVYKATDFELRATRRSYESRPIPFRQLSKLLSIFRPQGHNATQPHLYAEIAGTGPLELLFYAKGGRIEGVREGMYRYDPVDHAIRRVCDLGPEELELCYTPFNRRQYAQSAFCLFIVGAGTSEQLSRETVDSLGWRQAGHMGQILMERQAEMSLGLCPIGGLRIERWREMCGLGDETRLLHSFVGGFHAEPIPDGRPLLEATVDEGRFGRGAAPSSVSDKPRPSARDDLAIVGMGGRYPGAATLDAFWQNLCAGEVSFGALPPSRLGGAQKDGATDALLEAVHGGFLEDIECFDSLLFNISPIEAQSLDPQERLLLETVWECLEDAGYTSEALHLHGEKVGVFVGAMWNDYQGYGVEQAVAGEQIRAVAVPSSLANRLSYYFDFTGPSVTFNTSCASGMTALHFACESLKAKRCSVAIVCGVNLVAHRHHVELLHQLNFLSKDNTARPFGAGANGWVIGEGVGALLLKSREHALRDRDHIHGYVKGTSIAHNGRSFQYGAPNVDARAHSIREALEDAGVSAQSISYVETAVSGATIADAAEIGALKAVFASDADRSSNLYIGSLKGNIGHLESASALSQMTKVLLQFRDRTIAQTCRSGPGSSLTAVDGSGLSIADTTMPWSARMARQRDAPLQALVNVFGATGSAGHVVLEECASAVRPGCARTEPVVVPLSAASIEQLVASASRLLAYLQTERGAQLAIEDIGFTLCFGRVAMRERVAFVVGSVDELVGKLAAYVRTQEPSDGCYCGRSGADKTRIVDEVDPHGLAYRWVNGHHPNWPNTGNGVERRVSLPSYPFAKVRHWISAAAQSAGSTNAQDQDVPAHGGRKASQELEDFLVSAFAKVSGVPRSAIDPTAPLEHYGINSDLIVQLTARMEEELGPISKTLLFELRTLRQLAEHLAKSRRGPTETRTARDSSATPERKVAASALARSGRPRHERRSDPGLEPAPIAIIGLAGRYPQANTLDEFWQNLTTGKDCITEIPRERWDHDHYFGAERNEPGKTYGKWGGFVQGVDEYDALFFNTSPREAECMDPQERLFLQVSHQTFEDAGYSRAALQQVNQGSVGVFVGVMYGEYQLLNGWSCYGSIANRVSYFYGLRGPSMAVDTMCSSSLTALHLAVQSIQQGECELALTGGVNLSLHPAKYLTQAQLMMLSSDGRCRSFGERGDGMVPGEGVGAILLKPLARAVEDGDHIYGVIRGTAVNHGGKTNGYTVPNPNAQAHVIGRALSRANVDSRAISYVEAHGTGTKLGDPIEIAGLTQAFARHSSSTDSERQHCAIGSVKSNIGHLEGAAGIAAVTKVLLQMQHRTLVPSLHAETPNSQIDFDATPFHVQKCLSEWTRPVVEMDGALKECLRLAGVSSFGAGGANAHVVIEEHDEAQLEVSGGNAISPEGPALFILSAKNEERLKEQAKRLLAHISGGVHTEVDLFRIAYTLQVGRDAMEHRVAFTAKTLAELQEKLASFVAGKAHDTFADGYVTGEVKKHGEAFAILNSDGAFQPTLKAWIEERQYAKVLELWTKGLYVDWTTLYDSSAYAGYEPRRISLPTYPFLKHRHWVGPSKSMGLHAEEAPPVQLAPEAPTAPPASLLRKQWCPSTARPPRPVEGRYVLAVNGETLALGNKVAERLPGSSVLRIDQPPAVQSHGEWGHYRGWIDLVGCGDTSSHDIEWISFLQRWVENGPRESALALGVTRGLEAFGNSRVNLSGADRAGLYRMLSSEYARLRSRHVDLDADLDDDRLVECIALELGQEHDDVEICYRAGTRYRAVLQELEMPLSFAGQEEVKSMQFPPDKVLLVTGGTRGIGLLCAQHWVRHHGVRRLVLTGREVLPPRDLWNLRRSADDDVARKIRAVEALEAEGACVVVLSIPLNDEVAVRQHIDAIVSELGQIGGVIHCAGALDNATPAFVRKSTQSMQAVLSPKVAGLDHLLSCVRTEPLMFVVLFSSVSATIPALAVGLSDYALANAYMDYVANARSAELPIVSIQWPNWLEVGMGEVKSTTYRELGFSSLTNLEGLRLLEQVLATRPGPVVMPTSTSGGAPRGDDLMRCAGAPLARGRRPDVAQHDSKELVAVEIETLTPWLVSLVATELKLASSDIAADTPLHEYGADSIVLVQILRRIGERLGEDLEPSVLLEYPTIAEFGQWLSSTHKDLLARIEEPLLASAATENQSSTAPLEPVRATVSPLGHSDDADIAVVGLSCRLPGAETLAEFWGLLAAGHSAVRAVPYERMGRANACFAGLLENVTHFDPAFFSISANDAGAMDPQALVILEEALKAVCHAGYLPLELKGQSVGVYLGARSQHRPDDAALSAAHNPFVAVGSNFLASNVSRFFDLRGTSVVLDTACSSALVAMNMAIQAIRCGEISSALVGGVSLLTDGALALFERRGILNREPDFHLFDRRANGTILAEGAGLAWLKPLGQAVRDGDTVYAVVKGIATNNGGRTASPVAPNFQAQREVMRAALARSGKRPEDVGYVEVNGSGTEVTDLLELKAIEAEYRPNRKHPCELGSMKPNIGHPLCAEGIASFIKVVLMLHHGTTVPFLSAQEPMSHYDLQASPFRFSRGLTPWARGPMTAAINCFADGGTNAHVILESHGGVPAVPPRRIPQPPPSLQKVEVFSRRSELPTRETADLWGWCDDSGVSSSAPPQESHGMAFWDLVDQPNTRSVVRRKQSVEPGTLEQQ